MLPLTSRAGTCSRLLPAPFKHHASLARRARTDTSDTKTDTETRQPSSLDALDFASTIRKDGEPRRWCL
jgi:hypothetical protein